MRASPYLIVLVFAIALVNLVLYNDTRSMVDAIDYDVLCPASDPCPVDEYALSGFRQNEATVVFEYWPGQVPCDQFGTTFPCPNGGNPGVPDASIAAGIEEWSSVPSTTDAVYARLAASPADSSCGGVFSGLDTLRHGNDGRNTVMWAPLGGSVIGIACWWGGTNECDIILDNTWEGMANPEAARTVLLHESGHCMGLSHSNVEGAVMAATYSGPRHLSPDDIAGFCAIYGCTALPPTATPTPTASPSPTPTATPTATPTPKLYRCGDRVWTVPVTCVPVPGIAHD